MKLKKTLVNWAAEWRIKTATGYGWVNEFKNALVVGTTLKLMFELSIPLSVVLTIAAYLSWFVIGWVDLKKIGITQECNILNTSKYNPHLNKIKKL